MLPVLRIAEAELIAKPFPHFASVECLDVLSAENILRWLENDAPWRSFVDDFYEFEGVNLRDTRLPLTLNYLTKAPFLEVVRRDLEHVFGTSLGGCPGVAVQRLLPGRNIGVHTDFGSLHQTHRLILQLNRGWSIEQGGVLMLFDEECPDRVTDEHCLYLPEHRSAVGFAISETSYHAVSGVLAGERYSLCISFAHDG